MQWCSYSCFKKLRNEVRKPARVLMRLCSHVRVLVGIPLRVCMRLRCHVCILVYFLDLFRKSLDNSAKKRPRTKQTIRKLSQPRTLTEGRFKLKAANESKQCTNLRNEFRKPARVPMRLCSHVCVLVGIPPNRTQIHRESEAFKRWCLLNWLFGCPRKPGTLVH